MVNPLVGLNMPRKKVDSLTDPPDITLAVYRRHKTIMNTYR